MKRALFVFLVTALIALPATLTQAQWTPMNPVRAFKQEADGVVFSMGTGTLRVQVCSESIIHVLYSPTATFPKRTDFVIIKDSWPAAKWSTQSSDDAVTLSTSLLTISVAKKDGSITYSEANGGPLVQEANRSMHWP